MQEKAIELMRVLEDNGFQAYIVGGYVRDYLLSNESIDIDICTNARPMEIAKIFDIVPNSSIGYGSVTVNYAGYKFDVTTFRRDIKYENNRKPVKIKYISDVKQDLLRRDFTINTLCMDSDGNILDILDCRNDLDNHLIKCVGNPKYRIKEDSLRILRAIRFATALNFSIEKKTALYISKYGYLLQKLSYERKREELDQIFSSPNREYGRQLILQLKLDKYLDIPKLKDIVMIDDIIGIWSQLAVDDLYPFTKLEKKQMKTIRKLQQMDILDKYIIYKYDLYLCTVVATIKDISKIEINRLYSEIPIHEKKEIMIKPMDVAQLLHMTPSSKLKDIMDDIEKKIVLGEVNNSYDDLRDYVLINYKL